MPAQLLFQPNPPPDASLLPASVGALKVELELNVLSPQEDQDIKAFRRAADYIAAGKFMFECHSRISVLKFHDSDDLFEGGHPRRAQDHQGRHQTSSPRTLGYLPWIVPHICACEPYHHKVQS